MKRAFLSKSCVVIGLICLLAACGRGVETSNYSMPNSVQSVDGVPPHVLAQGPAAILKQRAQEQLAAGKLADADASLERALRFAPQDASVWYEFAVVRSRQNRAADALQMLKKASVYAGHNPQLQQQISTLQQSLTTQTAAQQSATSS